MTQKYCDGLDCIIRGKLQEENEKLKQKCDVLKKKIKTLFGIDNEECWTVAFLNYEKARYKQALVKIKKLILNDLCEPCTELEEKHCDECMYRIIIDIINEVNNV